MNDRCSFADDARKSFLLTFLRAAQNLETRVESSLGEAGLSLAKLGVLNHLIQAGEPPPLGQIAERISCVKSNMTQLIDRLEADGLVARINDPHDRRCVRASITDEGITRFHRGAEILARQEAILVSEIDPTHREQIMSCLKEVGIAVPA